jgi:DNA-binding transcriptional MerR regulator
MKNSWKWLVAAALLTAPSLTYSQGAEPSDVAKQLQQLGVQLKILQQSVDEMNKRVESLPTDANVDAQIRKALAFTHAEIENLKKQVAQLQQDVAALRVPDRKAYSPPVVSLGRIRLVNLYPTQMTIIVNERSYRLAPYSEQIIEHAAGNFYYQVLGVQPDILVRTLAPNETYTITVYPR